MDDDKKKRHEILELRIYYTSNRFENVTVQQFRKFFPRRLVKYITYYLQFS